MPVKRVEILSKRAEGIVLMFKGLRHIQLGACQEFPKGTFGIPPRTEDDLIDAIADRVSARRIRTPRYC